MKLRTIHHPLLIAVAPVLSLYLGHIGIVRLLPALMAMVVALLIASTIWFAFYLLHRDCERSALIASVLLALIGSYGHVYTPVYGLFMDSLLGTTPTMNVIAGEAAHIWLSSAYGLILLLAWRMIVRSKRPLAPATRWANFLGLFMIILPVLGLVATVAKTDPQEFASPRRTAADEATQSLIFHPDIYYIVLDGYGRADVLREYYGFDNAPFIEWLQSRGFSVVPESHVHYSSTALSLASTLNLRYISEVPGLAGRSSRDFSIPYAMIRDNDVARYLRSAGYRFIQLNSTWAGTLWNPHADEEIRCQAGLFHEDFYRALVENTWLRVAEGFVGEDLAKCHLQQFEALAHIAEDPGPKFVFAHFILPHHPYLFDRDGNVLRRARIANQFQLQARLWADREAYLEQLRFVNSIMKQTVSGIESRSDDTPIIILHSDHGPQLLDLPAAEVNRARFANFTAIKGPEPSPDFDEALSAVNLFRILFNHYLAGGFEILPDSFFVSNFGTPFDLRSFELH